MDFKLVATSSLTDSINLWNKEIMFSKFYIRKLIFVTIVVVTVLVLGCSKTDQIEGSVKDIFGSPLSDVSVSIENSAFKTKTSESGIFGIDYVPGEFVVRFAKEGFTSHLLELNLHQKENYPIGEVILYPIPSQEGIFFVDHQRKKLVALPLNSSVQNHSAGLEKGTTRFAIARTTDELMPNFQAGVIQFIDNYPVSVTLSKVRVNDFAIREAQYFFGNEKTLYLDNPQESQTKIGLEKVLLRSFELSAGIYSWVPYGRNNMGNSIPALKKPAQTFSVDYSVSSVSGFEQDPEKPTPVPNKAHISILQCAEQSHFNDMVLGENGIDSLYIKICPDNVHDIKIYFNPEIKTEIVLTMWLTTNKDTERVYTNAEEMAKVSMTENSYLIEPNKERLAEITNFSLKNSSKFEALLVNLVSKKSLAFQLMEEASDIARERWNKKVKSQYSK